MPQPFSLQAHPPRSGPKPQALDLNDLTVSLKSLLWQKVGLERHGTDLKAALQQIQSWIPYVLGSDFHEVPSWTVQNMLLTAYLITHSALRREESRGVHYRRDFPQRDDQHWKKHLLLSKEDLLKSL